MNITVRGLAEAKRLIGGVERQIPYATVSYTHLTLPTSDLV